jgi:putative nucleotidyltransferase with HDIG domain
VVVQANDARNRRRLYVLIALVTLAAGALLLVPNWQLPLDDPRFRNGVVAFAILGILCDTSFLRISFANINSSVAFIPFLASVPLFGHPWPMLIGGVTAAAVDTAVRKKPLVKVVFNTAQYMLAVGLGQAVYVGLGGQVALTTFGIDLIPFIGLVLTYFFVNSGAVTLAVSFSTGVRVRESWSRIVGGDIVYDLISSALAVLLVYLYVRFEFVGLAALLLPLFFVRHIYQMNQQLEQKNREHLALMVRAMEARDPYTSGHSYRVAEYAKTMARELGLTARQVDNIENAALLHDVGKMYEEFVPLLRKEGRLTPEERMLMQSHPVRSAELVSTAAGLRGAVQDAVRHHHENFDGSGYPDRLAGRAIPVGARIVMIADTLDAMTTDRPYRKALSFERVAQELRKYSGIQFDPELVELVISSPVIRRLVDGPPPLPSEPQAVFSTTRPAFMERARRAVGQPAQ